MNENKKNVTANQVSANVDTSTEVKEEAVMNNTATTEQNTVQQENIPAEQQNDQVPAVAEPEAEKVPFWTKVKNGAKKVGKVVGVAALVIGGVLVGEKIGEAVGFDKATDNYDKLSKSGDSSSDDDDEDDENEIDGGDYTEVDEE